MSLDSHEYLTSDEVAKILRLSGLTARNTVIRWARMGDLHGTKIAKRWLFTKADVLAFVESRNG